MKGQYAAGGDSGGPHGYRGTRKTRRSDRHTHASPAADISTVSGRNRDGSAYGGV